MLRNSVATVALLAAAVVAAQNTALAGQDQLTAMDNGPSSAERVGGVAIEDDWRIGRARSADGDCSPIRYASFEYQLVAWSEAHRSRRGLGLRVARTVLERF